MIEISNSVFKGTAQELRARVTAFRDVTAAHKLTEGVPAPREDELIERLAKADDEFQLVEHVAAAEKSVSDPVAKLRDFLVNNPDVLALVTVGVKP